jgi:Ca2+-transporting ATPase
VLPGDIILINEGDHFPVDGFVLEANGLFVDESSVTEQLIMPEKIN